VWKQKFALVQLCPVGPPAVAKIQQKVSVIHHHHNKLIKQMCKIKQSEFSASLVSFAIIFVKNTDFVKQNKHRHRNHQNSLEQDPLGPKKKHKPVVLKNHITSKKYMTNFSAEF